MRHTGECRTPVWECLAASGAILFIDLRGVGRNPVHSVTLSRKTLNPPLVTLAVSYDHVPTRPDFVLEGLHYRFFVRICHPPNMRTGDRKRHPDDACVAVNRYQAPSNY
jgi:hypothetical protein